MEVLPVADVSGLVPDSVAVVFKSYPLAPQALLTNGSLVPISPSLLSSSDPSVVVVGSEGLRTLREGSAAIAVTIAGETRTQALRVRAFEDRPVPAVLSAYDAGALRRIPVIDVRVIPASAAVPVDSLGSVQRTIDSLLVRSKYALEEGSRHRGYANAAAPRAVTFEVRRTVTYYRLPPRASGVAGMDYSFFVESGTIDAINRDHATQVWLTVADSFGSRWLPESAMSNPAGLCVSNSYADDCQNLPRANHTYVVYGYNPFRGWSCAVHNHGHQYERLFSYFDRHAIFNARFATYSRAGNVHKPPNTTVDYDYQNATSVLSDLRDWRPNGGTLEQVNWETWDRVPRRYSDSDNCGGKWLVYWFQTFPGRDHAIQLDAQPLENWWDIYADFDRWVAERRTLVRAGAGARVPGVMQDDLPQTVFDPATDYPRGR